MLGIILKAGILLFTKVNPTKPCKMVIRKGIE